MLRISQRSGLSQNFAFEQPSDKKLDSIIIQQGAVAPFGINTDAQ